MDDVIICKADRQTGRPTPSVVIRIEANLPPYKTLEDLAAFALEQATALEQALYDTLPGATYDRLLEQMLHKKASHFRVSHSA